MIDDLDHPEEDLEHPGESLLDEQDLAQDPANEGIGDPAVDGADADHPLAGLEVLEFFSPFSADPSGFDALDLADAAVPYGAGRHPAVPAAPPRQAPQGTPEPPERRPLAARPARSTTTVENEYLRHRESLLQLFGALGAVAHELKRRDLEQRLAESRDRFLREQLYVLVCGEFKHGKSSLINALLDEPGLFPVDIDIATALVSEIGYGRGEEITVYLGEPGSTRPKRITRAEIAGFVTERGNPRNERRARFLSIRAPNERLRDGLVLVDTPGVGGVNLEHSSITYAALPNADAVLFVSSLERPFSRRETEFLERVAEHCDTLVYVATKTDQVAGWQRVFEANRAKLAQIFRCSPEQTVAVAVSNLNKLRYLQTRDEEDLRDSNFAELESRLWALLTEQRGRKLLLRAVGELSRSVRELRAPLEAEWTAYQQHSEEELRQIEGELREAQQRFEALRRNDASWRKVLSRELRDAREDLSACFAQTRLQLQQKLATYLDDEPLVRQPEALGAQLAADLSLSVSDLSRRLSERGEQVHARIAGESQLDLNPFKGPVLSVSIDAPELPGSPGKPDWVRRALDVGRSAKMDSALGGSVGGLLGFLLGSFVPGVGNVAGAYVGAAVGALIGGSSGSQKALARVKALEHRERREEIRKILEPFLTDSLMTAQRELQKALRQMEDSISDDFLATIERERDALQRSVQAFHAARTERSSQQQRDERALQLRVQLDRLDRFQARAEQIAGTVVTRGRGARAPAAAESGSGQLGG